MFADFKKFDRLGRKRFGSAILIDDKMEERIDNIEGSNRFLGVIYAGLIMVILNLLTFNLIGLLITLFFIIGLYWITETKLTITFTKQRMLIQKEYVYPRTTKLLAISLVLWLLFLFYKLTGWYQITTSAISEFYFQQLASRLGILPFIYQGYYDMAQKYSNLLYYLEICVGIAIIIYFTFHFYFIKFDFKEVNYSHITEQLIVLRSKNNFLRIFTTLVFAILLLLFSQSLNLIFLLSVWLVYDNLPAPDVFEISYYGSSGRKLLQSFELDRKQLKIVARTSAELFDWGHHTYSRREIFPHNIIPKQASSYYSTGLQASLSRALVLGNRIGAVFSIIINVFVIFRLFSFAINYNPSTLGTVYFILLVLVVATIAIYLLLNFFSRIRQGFQELEFLMIGQHFVGRYINNKLWILKSNKLDGKKGSTKTINKFIQFDRARGLAISWRRFLFVLIIIVVFSVVLIWASIDAINLQLVIYIFPFLFDLGLEFISIKANAELSFFIILSFIAWPVIYYFFPLIYSTSRPRFILKGKQFSTIPTILRNDEDFQDVSIQFAKSIINSSRPTRRGTSGRLGRFFVNIVLKSMVNKGTSISSLEFIFGKTRRKSQSIPLLSHSIDIDPIFDQTLVRNLVLSAAWGYPIFDLEIYSDQGISLYNKRIELMQDNLELPIHISDDLSIVLMISIKNSES